MNKLKLTYFDFHGGRGEPDPLGAGSLDHVPAELADRVAPGLVAHCERIKTHPGVAAYYAERRIAL